ncbi:hypothetical protein PAXRUDRAFT_137116 [Paxillus rubicundulus Ve08.2h10]|uniref:Unplaced genomic scaffold scaffold_133, whole genome shotgun sequence n=1 Tax=Paxillus rubicundulus Ve08.2h10 TaxID=930991 RepID=A0A0D0E6D5_9AGAM|nr:hypothetical protein PAXRUDRAFT_137116 [Paxillus rubicundulus Ve08.2h10]
MATVKLATLAIRTIAKPLSAQLKNQATQHDTFRAICASLAQRMHTAEVSLRTNLLGEPPRHNPRPLSETRYVRRLSTTCLLTTPNRAIENGANALAEGFLFAVAALLILGESYRSSRNQSKRRDNVDEQLEELSSSVTSLKTSVDALVTMQEELEGQRARNDELARIVQRMLEIGLRGGWAEFEGAPLKIPRVELVPPELKRRAESSNPDSSGSSSSTS